MTPRNAGPKMATSHAVKQTRRRERRLHHQDFGAALGASHSFGVKSTPHGPFGVAALLDEIRNRLVSNGGRPSDSSPTIRRLVPIKKKIWRTLKAQAANLSSYGKRVSPAQLAAILVEKSISELESQERHDLNAAEFQAYCDRIGARIATRGLTAAKLKRIFSDGN